MSQCNYCGITDLEITPKHIKDYLGEIPLPKDERNFEDSWWYQTDNMFHTAHNIVYCNMCSQDHYKKESEEE